jgi:hypothetical protein
MLIADINPLDSPEEIRGGISNKDIDNKVIKSKQYEAHINKRFDPTRKALNRELEINTKTRTIQQLYSIDSKKITESFFLFR